MQTQANQIQQTEIPAYTLSDYGLDANEAAFYEAEEAYWADPEATEEGWLAFMAGRLKPA
jgi:hypothetical protein